jgi:hypothetical protein
MEKGKNGVYSINKVTVPSDRSNTDLVLNESSSIARKWHLNVKGGLEQGSGAKTGYKRAEARFVTDFQSP